MRAWVFLILQVFFKTCSRPPTGDGKTCSLSCQSLYHGHGHGHVASASPQCCHMFRPSCMLARVDSAAVLSAACDMDRQEPFFFLLLLLLLLLLLQTLAKPNHLDVDGLQSIQKNNAFCIIECCLYPVQAGRRQPRCR